MKDLLTVFYKNISEIKRLVTEWSGSAHEAEQVIC